MHFKEFYYLKSEFRGCAAGTEIRVHDWNDVAVEISINGGLIWIPISLFKVFFTDNPEKVQKNVDLNGFRFYV